MLITKTSSFNMGIAVAPITDWKFVDSAFAEKYMQTENSNLVGYQNSSALNLIAPDVNLTNCAQLALSSNTSLVLIQGIADEDVRPLNVYNYILRLQQCGIPYDAITYPNVKNTLTDANAKLNLYRVIVSKLQQAAQKLT